MIRVYNWKSGEMVETSGGKQARSLFRYLHQNRNYWLPTDCIVDSNDPKLSDWFFKEWQTKQSKGDVHK